MTTSQLKSIIKQTVKESIREELKSILVEAVTIASTPDLHKKVETSNQVPSSHNYHQPSRTINNLEEALQHTRSSMTSEDFRDIVGNSNYKPDFGNVTMTSENVNPTPQVGLDLSKLDFVQKAAAVYNKAVEKDRNK